MDEVLEQRVAAVLAELTIDEKISLVSGVDIWHSAAVPRLGVGRIRTTDGPHGARGSRFVGTTSACFPCGSALGATWDPALVEEVGAALADEARTKGAHVLLAPTVNLHRTPVAGRNFECFAEDPVLTTHLAVAYVQGVQSRGVAACIKHFVANEAEFERHTISSDVDERTLRELYLRPFEAAVKEAGVWSAMSSYNRINGVPASDHAHLLGEVLKGEWGFDGTVISDWYGTRSTEAAALAGLDLEMPGPPQRFGAALRAAVDEGRVPEEVLDGMVRRVLRLAARTGRLDHVDDEPERSVDDLDHRALARRVATEAIVLLRNDPVDGSPVLPLDPDRVQSIALIGPTTVWPVVQGGGSSRVNSLPGVSLAEALRLRAGEERTVQVEPGCSVDRGVPALDRRHHATVDTWTLEYVDPDTGRVVATEQQDRLHLTWFGTAAEGVDPNRFLLRIRGPFVAHEAGPHTFALTSVGASRLLLDGEVLVDNLAPTPGSAFYGLGSSELTATVDLAAGGRHDLLVEYHREPAVPLAGLIVGHEPPRPADLFERAVAAAATADVAVVVVGTTEEWESEGFDRDSLGLPGRQAALVAAVAAANPRTVVVLRGGAPFDLAPAARAAAVLQEWFAGMEGGPALTEVLFGDAEPGGRLPVTIPRQRRDTPTYLTDPGDGGRNLYGEQRFVGHRWYEARGIEPEHWFGHGLSYADLAWGEAWLGSVAAEAEVVATVHVDVGNDSDRPGSDVVQVYARDSAAGAVEPLRLVGFAKVRLEPGQSAAVAVPIRRRDLAVWDLAAGGWRLPAGPVEVRVARSAGDPGQRLVLDLSA